MHRVLVAWIIVAHFHLCSLLGTQLVSLYSIKSLSKPTADGKGYFVERGIRNAESCERVIYGKFNADFFPAE